MHSSTVLKIFCEKGNYFHTEWFEPLSELMDDRHIGLFQDSQFYFNDLKSRLLPVQHHFVYCYFVVSWKSGQLCSPTLFFFFTFFFFFDYLGSLEILYEF